MAEPVYHDIPTNPCSRCAGDREVAEMSWRDPAFSVTCVGCANMAVGDSVDAAIDAWDDANPERDVTLEESQAVKEQIVARLLTPPMLHAMTLAADAFDGTDSEARAIDAFVAWCQTLLPPQ